jgi:hypothetical protein
MVVWWGTPLEARSAFARLVRDGDISGDERVVAVPDRERPPLAPVEAMVRVLVHTDADGVVTVAGTRITLDTTAKQEEPGRSTGSRSSAEHRWARGGSSRSTILPGCWRLSTHPTSGSGRRCGS